MTKTVLIADDEASIVVSLEYLLEREGYQVKIARDGEEAWAAVEAFHPDLVLLDIMMPLKSGFDVCRQIRGTPALQNTRILMLTARGRDIDVSKGLFLGADAYMTKPFSTRELMAEVRRLLGEDQTE